MNFWKNYDFVEMVVKSNVKPEVHLAFVDFVIIFWRFLRDFTLVFLFLVQFLYNSPTLSLPSVFLCKNIAEQYVVSSSQSIHPPPPLQL